MLIFSIVKPQEKRETTLDSVLGIRKVLRELSLGAIALGKQEPVHAAETSTGTAYLSGFAAAAMRALDLGSFRVSEIFRTGSSFCRSVCGPL